MSEDLAGLAEADRRYPGERSEHVELPADQPVFAPGKRPDAFLLLHGGERFAIGGLEGIAMHTPGHTPNCSVYRIGDAAFVGDTLFMRVGREWLARPELVD